MNSGALMKWCRDARCFAPDEGDVLMRSPIHQMTTWRDAASVSGAEVSRRPTFRASTPTDDRARRAGAHGCERQPSHALFVRRNDRNLLSRVVRNGGECPDAHPGLTWHHFNPNGSFICEFGE